MATKEKSLSTIEPASRTVEQLQFQLQFDYTLFGEKEDTIRNLAHRVAKRWQDGLDAILDVGEALLRIKEQVKAGDFMEWLREEMAPRGLSYDRANSMMNFHKEYTRVQGTPDEPALMKIAQNELAAAYRLSTAPPDIKESFYRLTEDEETPPSRKAIEKVKQEYRKIQVKESGIIPDAAVWILQTPVASDPKELKRIANLSKEKQVLVSKAIASGAATSRREALQQIRESNIIDAEILEDEEVTAELERPKDFVKIYKSKPLTALRKLASESVNLAIIEAPQKFDFVDLQYPELLQALQPALAPGGFAIITLGHKAITATYDVTEANGLHVLQPLVLRLQPGRTSTIVGINMMTASRLALLVYKSPFRQPKGTVVDLQTVGQETDSQDEVPAGIEVGFSKFMEQLTHPDDVVCHIQLDPAKNFKMREHLVEKAESFASQFIAIG